jgi:hypothetical protein
MWEACLHSEKELRVRGEFLFWRIKCLAILTFMLVPYVAA